MSKETTEVVEVTVPVSISYSTPEGREKAIEWAQRELHLDGWSSEGGGISAKRVRGER